MGGVGALGGALVHQAGFLEASQREVEEAVARTDQHAAGLRRRATSLEQQAGHVPGPLGERLRGNATRLRELADAHHRTRISLQDGTE
jgi:hypothetical protein